VYVQNLEAVSKMPFLASNDIEGLPFVPEATKIFIARLMFAAAGVMCLFSAANFLWFLKPVPGREKALLARLWPTGKTNRA
jgi:hypothetical protein